MMNLKTATGKIDPIQCISLVNTEAGIVFKIKRVSCKTGYISSNGIVSSLKDAFTFPTPESNSTVLDTYADLQSYDFKAGVSVEFVIREDEDKNRTNTFYEWTGEVLKWLPETDNTWQPTV